MKNYTSRDTSNYNAIKRISSTYLIQLNSSYYSSGFSWIVVFVDFSIVLVYFEGFKVFKCLLSVDIF